MTTTSLPALGAWLRVNEPVEGFCDVISDVQSTLLTVTLREPAMYGNVVANVALLPSTEPLGTSLPTNWPLTGTVVLAW
jgi:hypothetical protein